jgi:hypothetical protein
MIATQRCIVVRTLLAPSLCHRRDGSASGCHSSYARLTLLMRGLGRGW